MRAGIKRSANDAELVETCRVKTPTGAMSVASVDATQLGNGSHDEMWMPMDQIGFSRYEISTLGIVRIKRTKLVISVRRNSRDSAVIWPMGDNGMRVERPIHVLMASMFLPVDESRSFIKHKNNNKADNRLDNLERATKTEYETMHRPWATNTKGKRPIICMKDEVIVGRYDSLLEAHRATGVHLSSIGATCNGRHALGGGFKWIYAETEEIPGETWKIHDVLNLPVSSHGRVKNRKGMVTYGKLDNHGYYSVKVDNKKHAIHHVVCHVFHGPRPAGFTVDHLDHNPKNNAATNLRYATMKQQSENRRTFSRKVRQLTLDGEVIREFESAAQAERHVFGKITASVSKCCKSGTARTGNFKWQYVEERRLVNQ